jgi:hypothetical protein
MSRCGTPMVFLGFFDCIKKYPFNLFNRVL